MIDVLIIGAGPAGLAAARGAVECGASVTLIDDNPAAGGQIWRALPIPREWISKPEVIYGARVIAAEPGRVTIETMDGHQDLACRSLILATGARERFLPFPGWTLPHVTGAGGLQALAKSGLPIAGKRVVIAGSGPLLLAVAKYMRDHGAQVPLVAEQASQWSLMKFAFENPGKLAKGLALRVGVRYVTSCWPVSTAPGSVTLRRGGRTWTERCDYLACGFGLIPNTEVAELFGCKMSRTGVVVDERQQTSVTGVYAAGEVTGIGGLDVALAEGEAAGYAAAGKPGPPRPKGTFVESLERAFALREELKSLATDDTFVCRCEDVALGRVRACSNWREAKLHTRCGMGPCQGRVCGGAVEFLLGWRSESVRPPVFPARIETLSGRPEV